MWLANLSFIDASVSSGRVQVHLEHNMTKLKFMAQASVAALAISTLGGAAVAQQQLSRALSTATQSTAAGAAAQARIDRIDDETNSVVGEYRAALQETETVALNVEQQRIFLRSQQNEIDSISSQIARVDEVQDQLLPMMLRMIGNLEDFVNADVPFQMGERQDRIQKLKDLMEDPAQSPSERYRQIINAYQIELSYGNQTTSYSEPLVIDGSEARKVEFLRVGRVTLMYTDTDASMHIWSQANKAWEDLPSSYALDISSATRIALEQKTPEVFPAPLPGATKVN
ncbi:MAG: hypothetical protein COA47_14260 [Robiginitomaculum sp.]|nr:MAG: hypothetical protein COA47_14260 [Robiginitomaculum sp.]